MGGGFLRFSMGFVGFLFFITLIKSLQDWGFCGRFTIFVGCVCFCGGLCWNMVKTRELGFIRVVFIRVTKLGSYLNW